MSCFISSTLLHRWLSSTLQGDLLAQEKTITKAFEFFDLKNNGVIDASELEQVLGEEEGRNTLNRLDLDQNGSVSREEFGEFVRALAAERMGSSSLGGDGVAPQGNEALGSSSPTGNGTGISSTSYAT